MKRSVLVYAIATLLVYSCIPPGGGLDDDPGTPIPKEASIEGLGTLPIREEGIYYSTVPRAMSADGSIVVGSGKTAKYTTEAFRWENGVMTAVEGLPPSDDSYSGVNTSVEDMSPDGSILVGKSKDYTEGPSGIGTAVAWRNGEIEALFGKYYKKLSADAVSDDGAVILINSNLRPMIWKKDTIIDKGVNEVLADVNSDGSVIVGTSADSIAVRWVDGKVEELGITPGAYTTKATAVNSDGSVVVMNSYYNGSVVKAFRWKNGKVQALDSLLPGESTYAYGVSADGSVIVGQKISDYVLGSAFIWTEELGMRDLKEFLKEEYDLDLEERWSLEKATSVSDDGTVICGLGKDLEKADGDDYYEGEPWRVVLKNE